VADANAVYLCRELRALASMFGASWSFPTRSTKRPARWPRHRSFDVVFTPGRRRPTHDDVTIEGSRVPSGAVVRDPAMVAALEGFYGGSLNPARIRMAEIPEGAKPMTARSVFPAVIMRNSMSCRPVPELFAGKVRGAQERFHGSCRSIWPVST